MLENFNDAEDRLDDLFVTVFQIVKVSKEFKKFCLITFTLFHENADVERGFSCNKNCLQDNLKEDSLIATKRIISDEIA